MKNNTAPYLLNIRLTESTSVLFNVATEAYAQSRELSTRFSVKWGDGEVSGVHVTAAPQELCNCGEHTLNPEIYGGLGSGHCKIHYNVTNEDRFDSSRRK